MSKTTFNSYAELERQARDIVAAIGSDSRLATAALANPVLALEEAGYAFSPALRKSLLGRLRFGEADYKRLMTLERKIEREAGASINPLDDKASNALIDRLVTASDYAPPAAPKGKKTPKKKLKIRAESLVEATAADPLEARRDEHPIVLVLLEARSLLRSAPPRFASEEDFARLLAAEPSKSGDIRLSNVRFYYPESPLI